MKLKNFIKLFSFVGFFVLSCCFIPKVFAETYGNVEYEIQKLGQVIDDDQQYYCGGKPVTALFIKKSAPTQTEMITFAQHINTDLDKSKEINMVSYNGCRYILTELPSKQSFSVQIRRSPHNLTIQKVRFKSVFPFVVFGRSNLVLENRVSGFDDEFSHLQTAVAYLDVKPKTAPVATQVETITKQMEQLTIQPLIPPVTATEEEPTYVKVENGNWNGIEYTISDGKSIKITKIADKTQLMPFTNEIREGRIGKNIDSIRVKLNLKDGKFEYGAYFDDEYFEGNDDAINEKALHIYACNPSNASVIFPNWILHALNVPSMQLNLIKTKTSDGSYFEIPVKKTVTGEASFDYVCLDKLAILPRDNPALKFAQCVKFMSGEEVEVGDKLNAKILNEIIKIRKEKVKEKEKEKEKETEIEKRRRIRKLQDRISEACRQRDYYKRSQLEILRYNQEIQTLESQISTILASL